LPVGSGHRALPDGQRLPPGDGLRPHISYGELTDCHLYLNIEEEELGAPDADELA